MHIIIMYVNAGMCTCRFYGSMEWCLEYISLYWVGSLQPGITFLAGNWCTIVCCRCNVNKVASGDLMLMIFPVYMYCSTVNVPFHPVHVPTVECFFCLVAYYSALIAPPLPHIHTGVPVSTSPFRDCSLITTLTTPE